MSISDDLIDRFLDGDVSEAEAAELSVWLEVSTNLQHFVRRAELHADLRSSLKRRNIQKRALSNCHPTDMDSASRTHETFTDNLVGSWAKSTIGVVAVVIAASLLIALVIHREESSLDSSQMQLATVVSEIDAMLMGDGSEYREVGLVAGDYELPQGLLHLHFDGGVMVYVEAPARFDVVSAKRLVLHHGRLSANVPPEGLGFTVDTPEAEVVDFGTEFSVDVGAGTSEVHVFEGLVRVQPKARHGAKTQSAVDLRTSQAVKINEQTEKPVEIELAKDRFIRTFDESRRGYARTVKRLSAVAFYRMAIRDQGLACVPSQYSGVVLMGDGRRPPHARGVFSGGSLRVLADSAGRGGRVDRSPPLRTGQFTLATFVYLESKAHSGIVATNILNDSGNFSLELNDQGLLQATIRDINGHLSSVSSSSAVPLQTWRHLVMTADGERIRLYEDGDQVASVMCSAVADSEADVLWFGTDSGGSRLWDGRIDEVAMFDRALSDADVRELYLTALEQIGNSQ